MAAFVLPESPTEGLVSDGNQSVFVAADGYIITNP